MDIEQRRHQQQQKRQRQQQQRKRQQQQQQPKPTTSNPDNGTRKNVNKSGRRNKDSRRDILGYVRLGYGDRGSVKGLVDTYSGAIDRSVIVEDNNIPLVKNQKLNNDDDNDDDSENNENVSENNHSNNSNVSSDSEDSESSDSESGGATTASESEIGSDDEGDEVDGLELNELNCPNPQTPEARPDDTDNGGDGDEVDGLESRPSEGEGESRQSEVDIIHASGDISNGKTADTIFDGKTADDDDDDGNINDGNINDRPSTTGSDDEGETDNKNNRHVCQSEVKGDDDNVNNNVNNNVNDNVNDNDVNDNDVNHAAAEEVSDCWSLLIDRAYALMVFVASQSDILRVSFTNDYIYLLSNRESLRCYIHELSGCPTNPSYSRCQVESRLFVSILSGLRPRARLSPAPVKFRLETVDNALKLFVEYDTTVVTINALHVPELTEEGLNLSFDCGMSVACDTLDWLKRVSLEDSWSVERKSDGTALIETTSRVGVTRRENGYRFWGGFESLREKCSNHFRDFQKLKDTVWHCVREKHSGKVWSVLCSPDNHKSFIAWPAPTCTIEACRED